MPNYRRRYDQFRRFDTAKSRAALAHIEEARAFEQEIGGSVQDVRQYFFSLDSTTIGQLLSDYGVQYGRSAEAYARATLPRWKAGTTSMSGLVAKRLFDFLPPRMPPSIKLELAGNIWRHFGTRSSNYFTVGPDADVQEVISAIQAKLDTFAVDHRIPDEVRRRFNWLSQGDIAVKEFLLNYFRRMDGKIAAEGLRERLPILQGQMREHSDHTNLVRTSINVHNHSIEIILDPRLGSSFREGLPTPSVTSVGSYSGAEGPLIIAATVLVVVFLLSLLR